MVNRLLDDPLFACCAPAATLRAKPPGFVDVGPRGGIRTMVEPLSGLTTVLGFEADVDECACMRSRSRPDPVFGVEIRPSAQRRQLMEATR